MNLTRQKHLLHVFPTFAVGGSQIRFGQLVRLHGTRYRHTVVALDGDTAMASRLEGLGVTLHPIRYNKQSILGSWGIFRTVLRRLRPDALITYNWGSIEWAIVNKLSRPIPHVHIEDGFGPEEAKEQLRRRVWTRRLALAGREMNVILPSRVLERIAAVDWKVPQLRLHYIPNGIDCTRFSAPERPSDSVENCIVIGTVATLRKEKNIARLIHTFSVLASGQAKGALRLLIVGDGPERGALEMLAASVPAGDQIIFAGASNCPEKWLRNMHIFALSSDTEQMPLSVLEAMASGLPIVSTNVGDVAQMVGDANADFVVSTDEKFRAALATLVEDPARRLATGRENEKRARALFDEAVMAKRYGEIIG